MDRVLCAQWHGEAVRGGGGAPRHAALVAVARHWSCVAVGRPGVFLSWKSGHGVGCAQSRLRGGGCVCVCVFVSAHRLSTMVV